MVQFIDLTKLEALMSVFGLKIYLANINFISS